MMDAYLRLDDVPFDDLWGCFRSAAAATATPKMYCVADALDEMEGGTDEFLHQLLDLGKSNTSIIKALATSCKSPHIVAILGSPSCVAISLEQRLVDRDIITYVDNLMISHEEPKIFAKDQRRIKEAVSMKTGGLFLYPRLMMHQLLPKLGLESVGTLLENLPSGLDEMYT